MSNPSNGGQAVPVHVPAAEIHFDPWPSPDGYTRGDARSEVAVVYQSEDLSVVFGKFRIARGGSVRLDIKADDHILVERGPVRLSVIGGDIEFIAHPGDYYVIPAGVSCWWEALDDYEDWFYQEASGGPVGWVAERMKRGLGAGLPHIRG